MLLALLRSLYWVPVFGRIVREAMEGPPQAIYIFAANIVMSAVLAVIFFGTPALITILLMAVATMFVIIFDITRD